MAEIFDNSTPEEEMVSWLQYHLEEDGKDYCCGIFGGKAESILELPRAGDEEEKQIAAEAAAASLRGRAAGNISQTGRQVFRETRISKHSAAKHGLPPRPRPIPGMVPSRLQLKQKQQQQLLYKRYQSFSQPGVLPKTKFHSSLGWKCPELPAKDVMPTVAATSIASATTLMESSASESSSTVIYASEAGNQTRVPSQCANSHKAAEKVLERNESWSCSNDSDHLVCKSMNLELNSSGENGCGNLWNENRKVEVQIPCKPSITSSSGDSLSSPVKESESGRKGKQEDTDEMECESEEAEGFSGDTSKQSDISKQPSTRTCSLKRSRAAQVHNLSEKRRRSRINEKMKALQNLIPNSNKTDKASMLDEAIEYLKLLQLQVQLLSMRNGLNASAMYVPVVPYMQMPQMCIGMNTGHAGMHTGMGLLDMSQGCSGQPRLDLPNPPAGCFHPTATTHISTTATNTCGSVETSCGVDSSQVDISFPQLPAASQVPQEMYTAYLLPWQPTHLNHSSSNPSAIPCSTL